MKNNILFLVLSLILVISCSPNEEYKDYNGNIEYSVTVASGDWFVQAFIDGVLDTDYTLLTTSNTAADDGTEIQINDHQNFYWYNTQSPIDLESLTFSGTDLDSSVPDGDDNYDINVTITNGKIIKNGATPPSGVKTDSIAFDIVYSDDPSGTVYQIRGYKSTKFLEDLH